MKKIQLVILIATLTIATSCTKFLEQTSQDLVKPLTVAHYTELLQGEAYFKDLYKNGWFVDVMTDNVAVLDLVLQTNGINAKAEHIKYAYQWGADLEAPTGNFKDKLFQTIYKNILTANLCMEKLDVMEGTEAQKNILNGQAHFTRAYGYFLLANLYAQAYNESELTDLCVPIITETTPSLKRYNRATIKEVWDLITSDITIAVSSLKRDAMNRSVYEINYRAALVLATRIHLFKEEYDQVIAYGNEFMQTNPVLKNISAINGSPNPTGASVGERAFLYTAGNPEVLFTFARFSSATAEGGYVYYLRDSMVGLQQMALCASADDASSLIDKYSATDKRKTHWFSQPQGSVGVIFSYPYYTPVKVNFHDLCRTTQAMRSAEVYLNLAEAYARKQGSDPARAIDLLNQLRVKRLSGYNNLTAADFSSPKNLVDFVWEERRRELCFEEFHRWWDLRRTGQPALQHRWMNEVYKLGVKDKAYVLNFPKDELEFNPDLVPNFRPDRSAE